MRKELGVTVAAMEDANHSSDSNYDTAACKIEGVREPWVVSNINYT